MALTPKPLEATGVPKWRQVLRTKEAYSAPHGRVKNARTPSGRAADISCGPPERRGAGATGDRLADLITALSELLRRQQLGNRLFPSRLNFDTLLNGELVDYP